jgi:hypothetical protein
MHSWGSQRGVCGELVVDIMAMTKQTTDQTSETMSGPVNHWKSGIGNVGSAVWPMQKDRGAVILTI